MRYSNLITLNLVTTPLTQLICGYARLWVLFCLLLSQRFVWADAEPNVVVGEREVVNTKAQRDALGLKWFVDGNFGVLMDEDKYLFYGANGSLPVRTTGTRENPFQRVERVKINSKVENLGYLSGGPVYRDQPRIVCFYFTMLRFTAAHHRIFMPC